MAQIEHNWQRDPAIAQTVEGDGEYGGNAVVSTQDRQVAQFMAQMLERLERIEYHLMLITNADLKKGNL